MLEDVIFNGDGESRVRRLAIGQNSHHAPEAAHLSVRRLRRCLEAKPKFNLGVDLERIGHLHEHARCGHVSRFRLAPLARGTDRTVADR